MPRVSSSSAPPSPNLGALNFYFSLGWLALVSDCAASAVSAAVMPSGTASDAATALASVLSSHADRLTCSLAQVLLMPSASSGSTDTWIRTLSLIPPSLPQISRMRKSPQIRSLLRTSCKLRPPICHKSQVTIGGCRGNPPMPCSPKLAAAQNASRFGCLKIIAQVYHKILRKCLRYAVSKTCACLAYLLYCKYLRKTCARLSDRWQIWNGSNARISPKNAALQPPP